jgi:hypothetical protein
VTATTRPLPALVRWQMDLLRAIRRHMPGILAGRFRPNCCIASSRILLDFLELVGLPAEPIVVEVLLLSPGWLKLQAALGREPTLAEMQGATGHDVWSVGLGVEDPPPGGHIENPAQYYDPTNWSGHLVVLARLGPLPFLLDPSLRQAERPQYSIRVPDFVLLPVTDLPTSPARPLQGTPTLDQPEGTLAGVAALAESEGTGTGILYRRRKQWQRYDDAPDWDGARWAPFVLELAAKVALEVGPCPESP